MPRYYFHLRNDVSADDHEGVELPDLNAARARATEEARQMVSASALEHGKIDVHHRIEISDENGKTVAVVEFGDAVKIVGLPA